MGLLVTKRHKRMFKIQAWEKTVFLKVKQSKKTQIKYVEYEKYISQTVFFN